MTYKFCLTESPEDKLAGYVLIHSLNELMSVIVDTKNSHVIIMGKDAVEYFFTTESYASFIKNAKKLNPLLTLKTHSAKMTAEEFILEKISYARRPQDIFKIISSHPRESYKALKGLASRVQQAKLESLTVSNKVAEMSHKVSVLEADKDVLNQRNEELQKSVDYNARMFEMLKHRLQHKFLSPVEEDSLNFCTSNSYDKVLYIKEISGLEFTWTLIQMLQQIILMLYQTPCRICVIESYGSTLKRYQYPNLVVHTALTTSDILSADILMEGYQPRIMEDFMHNGSGSSFAIVFDRDKSDIIHVQGNNVSTYFIAGNPQDIYTFNLPKAQTISKPGAGCLCIPEIDKYDTLTSSEKLTSYSNLSIVNALLSR